MLSCSLEDLVEAAQSVQRAMGVGSPEATSHAPGVGRVL